MKIEYELRMLDIDFSDMMKQVESLGGKRVGSFHQKRFVYDYNPVQKGRWIRLRSNGVETTLTLKEIKALRIDGTKELEIVVSDFEDTAEILHKLGYTPRTFQENFRVEYKLDGVNLDFDKWPMIPPYLEIEGESEEAVRNMISKLGLDISAFVANDVDTVYSKNYGIELDSIKELRFNAEEITFIQQFL